MTGKRHLPHHDHSGSIGLDDHRVQRRATGHHPPSDVRFKPEVDPRQGELQRAAGREVQQLYELAAAQLRSLILRRALVETILEVDGQERSPTLVPRLIIGARQFDARGPVASDGPKPRRLRTVFGR